MNSLNWSAFAFLKRKKQEEEPQDDAKQHYLMVRAVNNQIYNIKVPDEFVDFGYQVEVRNSDGDCVYRARKIKLSQWLIDLHTQPSGEYNIVIHCGLQMLTKKICKI